MMFLSFKARPEHSFLSSKITPSSPELHNGLTGSPEGGDHQVVTALAKPLLSVVTTTITLTNVGNGGLNSRPHEVARALINASTLKEI
jgi:hypothetical protein